MFSLLKYFFTELIENINVRSSCDMGERLLVCAVQVLESSRFSDSEVLCHFLFEDIKVAQNSFEHFPRRRF